MPPSQIAVQDVLPEVEAIFRYVMRDGGLAVTPDTTPDDLPDWDSMNHLALVVEAECRFGPMFEPEEIETFHSVGDPIAAILAKAGP
jgi:acyl carrier protein